MRANNLAVSLPNNGCDRHCPFCVSKMTGYLEANFDLMIRNVHKVVNFAKMAGVGSVLFTGKGEPFLSLHELFAIAPYFSDFPIEIQTNGKWLARNRQTLSTLNNGLKFNVIAISVNTMEDITEIGWLFEKIQEEGMLVRLCVNLTNMFYPDASFKQFFGLISTAAKINQLLIRRITVPQVITYDETYFSASTAKWINENAPYDRYATWLQEFVDISTKHLIRVLPHEAQVYDLDGISVSFSDWCIQEANNTEDIRSLIFMEDGHLWTSWDKKSSRLF